MQKINECMTSRERVAKVLRKERPDRVPVDFGSTASNFTINTFKRVKEYFGIGNEKDVINRPDESAPYNNDDLLEAMGGDFRHVYLMPSATHCFTTDNSEILISELGIRKKKVQGLIQNYDCPLEDADIDDIDKYPWPDPKDKSKIEGLRERAEDLYYNTDYAIASKTCCHGLFELAWELRGMEKFMCDMLIDKKFANKLLDKILELQFGYWDALLSECGKYVQIVETCDDYGAQNGLMFSRELFKELIFPRRKQLNDFIKSKAPQAKIFLHSCGSVYEILDLIIDTGVEVLNPVQTFSANMDPDRLQKEFGNSLVFHGAIDQQKVLVGPIEGLEAAMKNRVETLGRAGGYIMAPTSNFQDDMPLENIVNFSSLARKVGKYT